MGELKNVWKRFILFHFSSPYLQFRSISVVPVEQTVELRIVYDVTLDAPIDIEREISDLAKRIQSYLLELFPLDVEWIAYNKGEMVYLHLKIQDNHLRQVLEMIKRVETKLDLARIRLEGSYSTHVQRISRLLLGPSLENL